jgi:hypothetical protein
MHPEVCSTSAAFHERCRAVPARLTGAKEEPVEAACPHQGQRRALSGIDDLG